MAIFFFLGVTWRHPDPDNFVHRYSTYTWQLIIMAGGTSWHHTHFEDVTLASEIADSKKEPSQNNNAHFVSANTFEGAEQKARKREIERKKQI